MKLKIWNMAIPLLALISVFMLPLQAEAQERAPDIQKDVITVGNNSGSFDVGQEHTWLIRSEIPSGIGNAQAFEIVDNLNYRLHYEAASTVVRLYARDGRELRLEENGHYILVEETCMEKGQSVDSVTVSLTPEGMSYVAENLGEGIHHPELRVYLNAKINAKTAMGSTIPNDAHLYYRDCAGIEYSADSDIPEVHTGGIHVRNSDGRGMPLNGAVFMIAREATQAEMETETITKEILEINGKNIVVTYRSIYDNENMSGEKVDTVTTDENGEAVIYGLAYGTYYLVEIEAPAGYDILAEPVKIQINETSHLTALDGWRDMDGQVVDNTLKIVHNKFLIPYTGGRGTTTFSAYGAILLFCAGFLLVINKRKYP